MYNIEKQAYYDPFSWSHTYDANDSTHNRINYMLYTMAFITNYSVAHIYQVIHSTRLHMVKEIAKATYSVIDEQVHY